GCPWGQVYLSLGHDVLFYVFSLPFFELVRSIGQALVLLAALGAAGLYLVSGSLTAGFPARLSVTDGARRHLSLLAAAFFLLLGFSGWLGRAERLVQASGLIHGAAYADVHGRMPLALLVVAAAVLGAALAALQATSRRNWPIPLAIVLYVAAAAGSE